MEGSILIKANGFYLIEWDSETGTQISSKQIKNQISKYLSAYAEFDESATVGNFLYLLNDFADETEYIFSSYLNGVDFNEFLKESLTESTKPQELDFIDLVWNVRIIVSEEMNILDILPTMIGVKELKEDPEMDEIHDLDFIELRDIAHLKICAATSFDVPDPNTYQIGVSAEKRWTLYEIISGFLSEISKHGSPADRLLKISEITEESKMSLDELLEYMEELESSNFDLGNSGIILEDDDEDDD